MAAGDLCNREVIVASPDTSVAEAAALMRQFHVGDLVIVEDEQGRKPIGIVTDRDIVVEIVAANLRPEDVTVMDIITEPVEVTTEDTDFWDALAQMRRRGVRRLPVVNAAGELQGILTADDAMELIGEAMTSMVALVSRELDREKTHRSGA